MKIVQIKVYKFHELKEDVRDKVVDNWRNDDSYLWSSENNNVLNEFVKLAPVKVQGFEYGYRKYINFSVDDIDFRYDDEIQEMTGVRLWKYLRNHFPALCEMTVKYQECPLTGYYLDYDILKPLESFLKRPDKRGIEEIMSDCIHAWLDACDSDYDYWLSAESIIDDINANDYDFTVDGKICG